MERVNPKLVRVQVEPGREVLARRGAMVGYDGDVTFSPVSGAGSVGAMVGRALSGEGLRLMLARGRGGVLYGFAGLNVTVVELTGDSLTVEASRLLAHDASLSSSIVPVTSSGAGGGLGGLLRGAARSVATGAGISTTRLSGHGWVAVLSHGATFELDARDGAVVDPQAYVGHLGDVVLDLRAALSWRDAVGRGSGEGFQLAARGPGRVIVQASETKI